MSKLRISPYQNHKLTWCEHYILDPFIVMITLGAVGNMRNWPVLYSFSYLQVFLINTALQHILPIIVTSDSKTVASKEKIEL